MSSDYSHDTEEEEEEESLEEESLELSKKSDDYYEKKEKIKNEEKENDRDEDMDEEKEEDEDNYYKEEYEEKEETINIPEENRLIISLPLIKKFSEVEDEDSDDKIIDFLKKNGLPMEFKDIQFLKIYLYFHKMCVPFYKIFSTMKKKDNIDITLTTLKENYYLLVNSSICHFNYENISEKIFNFLNVSKEPYSSNKCK